jgi:hypothetical protein
VVIVPALLLNEPIGPDYETVESIKRGCSIGIWVPHVWRHYRQMWDVVPHDLDVGHPGTLKS